MGQFVYLGGREEHESGSLKDRPSGTHLGPSPFVLEVVLPVSRHVSKVHHFASELAKGFDEFCEIVYSFQSR